MIRRMYEARRRGLCQHPGCDQASAVGELDHVRPDTKTANCSDFRYWSTRPVEEYTAELALCQVLCPAHHREKTARDAPYTPSERRARQRQAFVQEKLARKRCADCLLRVSDDNHWGFDFDHLPGFEKRADCSALKHAARWRLQQELAKCELVCVACHRDRTRTRLLQSHNAPRRHLPPQRRGGGGAAPGAAAPGPAARGAARGGDAGLPALGAARAAAGAAAGAAARAHVRSKYFF
jgi:hypothetical protein